MQFVAVCREDVGWHGGLRAISAAMASTMSRRLRVRPHADVANAFYDFASRLKRVKLLNEQLESGFRERYRPALMGEDPMGHRREAYDIAWAETAVRQAGRGRLP